MRTNRHDVQVLLCEVQGILFAIEHAKKTWIPRTIQEVPQTMARQKQASGQGVRIKNHQGTETCIVFKEPSKTS